MNKLALVVIVVSVAACGGKKKEADKPLDVAAVNALVPASLKDKIVFEKREIVEKRGRHSRTYTVAAPKGWKQEMDSFASLKPDKDMGFMTRFEVGSNCDGTCEEKDWSATIEKVYESYLKGKPLKDVKGKNSRTIIAESGDLTAVVVASWEDGAREYWSCGATLEKEIKELAPAVEKACESVSRSED
ncbi:hypothetical protein BH11MYX3_BH11MYX3_08280 [soil metagenome]